MCAHVCSVASSYDMLTDGSTKPQDAGWGMGNGEWGAGKSTAVGGWGGSTTTHAPTGNEY